MAIHPKFTRLITALRTKLITALRTVVENGEGTLDKDTTSNDDLFELLTLSLMVRH